MVKSLKVEIRGDGQWAMGNGQNVKPFLIQVKSKNSKIKKATCYNSLSFYFLIFTFKFLYLHPK